MSTKSAKPNRLIESKSPYLLQHAYNPVEWYPWGKEALDKAKTENKPILVSIGYAACHWCHVMEKESFENEQVASLMNRYFVCIKVDREERPDIDQIYMEAVQLMGQHGGWPLNVFLTPDTKPFYGGTYFPPQQWIAVLQHIARAYQQYQSEIEKSASELTAALQHSEVERYQMVFSETSFSLEKLKKMFSGLSAKFDAMDGGLKRAPKFPMPSIYEFLLRFHQLSGDSHALQHVLFTLDKMAAGGIYDHVGGGFARYSVDAQWFVPHFEKMLYDNAQLLNLYANAYRLTKHQSYRQIIEEIVDFLVRELKTPTGGFYASLDADSEGIEGKFYTWTTEELQSLLNEDFPLFADYYGITPTGNWEEGRNILHCTQTVEEFAQKKGLSTTLLQEKIKNWKQLLLSARNERVRPGLDDKILTSWNGLTIKGLVTAYEALDNEQYLSLALACARFLERYMTRPDGGLWHTHHSGSSEVIGFLEDYAAVIEAFLALYQVCFDEKWLRMAEQLTQYTLKNFFDYEEELFFFTDSCSENLIARKKEIFDNVIPASNSMMARNLYTLGILLANTTYTSLAQKMLAKVSKLLEKEVQYLSNWACLYADICKDTLEIVIVGEKANAFAKAFQAMYLPNKVLLATTQQSHLPLFSHREAIEGKTTIYICQNKTCQLPVFSVEEALKLIEQL